MAGKTKRTKIGWRRSIRIKILATSVLIATLVLSSSGYVLYDYVERNKTAELKEFTDNAAQRLSKHIEEPMWNVDNDQVGRLIEAEMAEVRIAGIVVRDEDRRTLFAGRERTSAGTIVESNGDVLGSHDFAREDVTRDGKMIGAITVFVSQDALQKELLFLTRITIVLVLTLDIVMLIGLGLMLGRLVIRPLERLAHHAEEVSLGRQSEQIAMGTQDEIGSLAEAMGRMQTSLKMAMDRLRRDRA